MPSGSARAGSQPQRARAGGGGAEPLAGHWIDQIDAKAPHEASLLNLPGRSGEPCGHAHPVMGACCCAA